MQVRISEKIDEYFSEYIHLLKQWNQIFTKKLVDFVHLFAPVSDFSFILREYGRHGWAHYNSPRSIMKSTYYTYILRDK